MLCADTSFLIDYLTGNSDVEAWLSAHENQPIHTPTVARWEIYRGALRSDAPGGLDVAAESLEWTQVLPFSDAAARETALVEDELREAGKQINVADRLIAGTAREAGATLVTRDDHFERVDGLEVVRYDEWGE